MTAATFHFEFKDLDLNVARIERILGYPEGESHETVAEHIREVLREAGKICSIKAEFRIFDEVIFYNDDKSVEFGNRRFNVKKTVFGQLKKSESIALFLCTAGSELGTRSRKAMQEGDLLTGYIYDVAGSEIVESAADLMQNELEEKIISTGRNTTNRFSPGYCGWDVEEQNKLFSLMPYNFCGIRLTPSALMDPVKSISGFIGIGKHVKHLPDTCNLCDMKDCIYRRSR